MAEPRSISLRALRALSRQHSIVSVTIPTARRHLHITGAHSAQSINSSNKSSVYSTRSIADLKQECVTRSLRTSGTKLELIERLTNFDMLNSRAFSIAMRRIDGSAFASSSNSRQFNTSRANKTVNDSSTVDFAYMPSFSVLEAISNPPSVPSIPMISGIDHGYESSHTQPPIPMKPQIYSVSEMASDMAPSPMSEVVDNHSVDIDPFVLTEVVGKSRDEEQRRKAAIQPQDQEPGLIGQLWTGFLDDLIKPHQSSSMIGQRI